MANNKILLMVLLLSLFAAGCADQGAQPNPDDTNDRGRFGTLGKDNGQNPNGAAEDPQGRTLTVVSNQDELESINVHAQGGKEYVPLIDVLKILDFTVREEDNRIQAGFTDVFIEVKENSTYAKVDGKEQTLSNPLITFQNKPYITIADLDKLFGTHAEIKVNQGDLVINMNEEYQDYGFPEDVDLSDLSSKIQNSPRDVPVVSARRFDRILEDGLDYMGVPYYFGAPSGYTRAFDCSSFTQYVYGINGIGLPRVARNQAKLGRYIPVSQLRPGDLLFFHWPGRNVLVGHVGIYAGDGYMLHSSPVPRDGVQVTNLLNPDSPYRDAYLGAKRISERSDIDW